MRAVSVGAAPCLRIRPRYTADCTALQPGQPASLCPGFVAAHLAPWLRCLAGLAAGDVNSVSIGERTNVQDNVLIHVARHNPAKAVRTAAGSASTACAPGSGRVQCH